MDKDIQQHDMPIGTLKLTVVNLGLKIAGRVILDYASP
jgi:hypothetical protein